ELSPDLAFVKQITDEPVVQRWVLGGLRLLECRQAPVLGEHDRVASVAAFVTRLEGPEALGVQEAERQVYQADPEHSPDEGLVGKPRQSPRMKESRHGGGLAQ